MVSDRVCVDITKCRICGSEHLEPVIDFGAQYIASAFVGDNVPDVLNRPYPMTVVRCGGDGCGLVQLQQSIDPTLLYADGYGYRSGTNELMRENLGGIIASIESLIDLKADDTVVDIGCNDGTLLDSYCTAGLDKVGFDPVGSIVARAREKGVFVINDFFAGRLFHEARPGKKARVVTSIAMFYDLERPLDFMNDVASMLADDGVWVIELSYLPTMLEKASFDTVCHEHLEYYALRQIEWMAQRADLAVHRVELNDMNGGSFRVYLRKQDCAWNDADRSTVETMRKREAELCLETDAPYREFRDHAATVRHDLPTVLRSLVAEGKTVYAYGASTKGNTILQYCGIDAALVRKAADRNPEKHGRRTLGTGIPIISEEQARAERPDYFLVLPWPFFAGFVKREADFLARGGKFILPLPEVRIVGVNDV